ncbi:MAG TPA: alpha/beta hydrolase-fold protein [Thermomicrobiaceae bacterium]|nr:alpha/beta hydrolase-fold protein [Thermomicrobiaceae bacterium]
MAEGPLDWSIVSGFTPLVLTLLGLAALILLFYGRERHWWTRWVPAVVLATALVALGTGLFVDRIWQPFPDNLPTAVVVWIGVVLGAVVLGLVQLFRRKGWRPQLLTALAMVVAVIFGLNQINREYDQYPTLRDALRSLTTHATPLKDVIGEKPLVIAPAGTYLSTVWHAPAGMPSSGTLTSAAIPATLSGFHARDAWVYLPPAYQATPRPRLPVLLLLAGQPGSPTDWVYGGDIMSMMNSFAARHDGLAPVVVMADATGSEFGNPMCMDSRLGKAQTYLTEDVPAWVEKTFQVDTDPAQWAVAGLSYGGTCALQFTVNKPNVFHSFISISGQDQPTLGTFQESVDKAFRGNKAAFLAVDPLTIMKTKKFPELHGLVVAGSGDGTYRPQQRRVYAACKAADMHVAYEELPGGHGWQVWRPGLEKNLDWLARQTMLAP